MKKKEQKKRKKNAKPLRFLTVSDQPISAHREKRERESVCLSRWIYGNIQYKCF